MNKMVDEIETKQEEGLNHEEGPFSVELQENGIYYRFYK